MNEVVAQTAFDGVDPGGARFRITVEIGRPWPIDDGDGAAYARCPVSVVPILNEKDIGGQDTFQALCLAVRFAQWALQAFVERGGRVLCVGTESDADLDAFKSN